MSKFGQVNNPQGINQYSTTTTKPKTSRQLRGAWNKLSRDAKKARRLAEDARTEADLMARYAGLPKLPSVATSVKQAVGKR